MSEALPEKITIQDKYDPAMKITDQAAADAYFERLVEHSIRQGLSRADAERTERGNLGYYAGYGFDRARVERLFNCEHPIFGKIEHHGSPSPEHAFRMGFVMARAAERRR